MEAVFLKLLNMSITAGWIVLALVILRPLLKKAPKWITCLMWAIVAVRLMFPFSIESVLSLIPSSETIPQDIAYQVEPEIHSGIEFVNSAVNPVISDSMAPTPVNSVNPLQVVSFIASWVWVIGVVVMVLYTLVSYIRLRLKVMESAPFRDNIRVCDHISTPFILGIIRPKIYLPSNMSSEDMEYVIAHETAHLKRRDHWWKPLGFALLAVYWFNPLMWVAYVLLCRDIEMACDEKVIGKMSAEGKISYSEALLNCSVSRKSIAACPLAFGEVGVKKRIKSVLNYKKPAFWIMIAAIVICIVAAVCFLTDPVDSVAWQQKGSDYEGVSISITSADSHSETIDMAIKWENNSDYTITHGEIYKVYKKENGEWVDWISNTAHLLERGLKSGHSFSSEASFLADDFKVDELYRLESEFSIPDLGIVNKKVWVEFCLKDEPDEDGAAPDVTATARPKITPYPTSLATPEPTPYVDTSILSYGEFQYNILSDDSVRVINYTGNDSKVVIPEIIDGKTVTGVDIDYGLKTRINEKVKEATIPATVTNVHAYNFSGWPNLEKLIFEGNAPNDFLVNGDGATVNVSPKDLAVYYTKGAAGFTSPSWNGMKCAEVGSEPDISSSGDYQYVMNSDNTVEIFRYTGSGKDVKIPEKINGKKVTSIGDMCFALNKSLNSVTIPDTVTEIGIEAFSGCSALTAVKGGKNLKTIDIQAFIGCGNLSDITLPEGLTRIGASAFHSCVNLKQINIPGTVKHIEYNTFCYSKLEKVTFNEGTEAIGSFAFSGCEIKELELPDSMKEIYPMAFLYTPVETVSLNNGLEFLADQAFRATEIKEVVIPATVKKMSDSSFAGEVTLKFEGNAPADFVSGYGLLSKESTIYYHEGAKGFTSPEWNGYKTAIW